MDRNALAQLLMAQQAPSQNVQEPANWRAFMANQMMNIPPIDPMPSQPPAPLPGAFGDLSRSMDSYFPQALAQMQARGGAPQHHYVFPMPYEPEYDPMNQPPIPHR